MMRHLSDSLSFSRTSSSGVCSGSRLGPAGGKFELLLSLPMPVSYSLRARTWGDGHMFLRDRARDKTTRPARSAIAVARVRRDTEHCLRPRISAGQQSKQEFDVESERQGGPQFEGPAEV